MIGAVGALVVAMLALVVALFFQLSSMVGPSKESIPEALEVSPQPIAASALDALFEGPQNLRFEPAELGPNLEAGTKLGELTAVSPSGLQKFEILGGTSAELVDEDAGQVPNPADGSTMPVGGMVLRVSERYARQLADNPLDRTKPHVMHVRVIATDVNGNLSKPQDVVFPLKFATAEAPVIPKASDEVENVSGPEDLERVWRGLAGKVAAKGTPEWWDGRAYAVAEAQRCGAEEDAAFDQAYVAAYARVERKLNKDNVQIFYTGLCNAWSDRMRSAAEENARLNTERGEIVARNLAKQATSEIAHAASRIARNVALAAALSAIMFFMTIALFLAFMAIEGHSNAVREALQVLTKARGDG